ncbi:hypothetical protein BGZ99_000269 [Dissophora globulifera]|uniref:Major facilitator superfamily (MFS) profile domain-containing protein n=1 Tax=Dissophora globulifera TaxID=979702 RepID=A0A9P6R196_9FUNG|nr:hypothetical protein BGZ99_000269 [Dissophora globulifera]
MLDIINVNSVTITLPDIQREVGLKSTSSSGELTSVHTLSYGAFFLTGGRLGDLFGSRLIFIVGATWFSIWALIIGFATDPVVMPVGRAVQGMGKGLTVPSVLAILITTYLVGPKRNQALAVFRGSVAMGSAIRVLLGGIISFYISIVQHSLTLLTTIATSLACYCSRCLHSLYLSSTRWLATDLYITSMIGFSMVLLGFLVILTAKGEPASTDRRIDYIGITSFTLGLVGVIYYLSEGPATGWASVQTLAPFLVGVVLLDVFLFVESRITYPIMPFRIWRSRHLVSSCLIVLCVSAGLNSLIFFASLTFHNVQGYSSIKTSLTYLAHGVGAIVTIMGLTKLVTRIRTKIILLVGWLFFISSGILFAHIKADSPYWSIAFSAFILNFMGAGSLWLCCQINSVADTSDEDQGVAGAFYNVSLQLGAPIGIAISNIIANSRNPPGTLGVDLLPGYRAAFYTCAVVGSVSLIVTAMVTANHDINHEETAPIKVATGTQDKKISMDIVHHAEGMETAGNSQISESTKDSYAENSL